MRLYKYMGLDNLWHVLDIVVRNRVYCAHWSTLNDPLEGRYELYFRAQDESGRDRLEAALRANRDRHRIASFSADPSHFLLWSHYADGHKGIAVELEISEEDPTLTQITYCEFSSIFTEDTDITLNHPHVFNGKTPEWEYEQEWRIITPAEFFALDAPCSRILLGPRIPAERRRILESVMPQRIELVETYINVATGRVEPIARQERV